MISGLISNLIKHNASQAGKQCKKIGWGEPSARSFWATASELMSHLTGRMSHICATNRCWGTPHRVEATLQYFQKLRRKRLITPTYKKETESETILTGLKKLTVSHPREWKRGVTDGRHITSAGRVPAAAVGTDRATMQSAAWVTVIFAVKTGSQRKRTIIGCGICVRQQPVKNRPG